MADVSAPTTAGVGTSPCNDNGDRPASWLCAGRSPETSHAARRRKKNLKRKMARRRYAAARALPPLAALGKQQFMQMTGCTTEEYDAYADQFIAAAKKAHRRWEFPHEAVVR